MGSAERSAVRMQVIALAERGALYDPGPCMYMEKLAVGPNVPADSVSLNRSIADNLQAVSDALNKPVRCVPALASTPPSLLFCVVLCALW